jgi:hypothetical protein
MVEVFKTNLEEKTATETLIGVLLRSFPSFKINFDLSDCDRVLRVEGENIESSTIMALVKENGFFCEVID